LTKANAALGGGQQGHQQPLEADEPERLRVLDGFARLILCDQRNDGIDDQLADERDSRGQQTGEHGQPAERDRQPAVRRPDENDRPAAVIEQIREISDREYPGRIRIYVA
jgi:hypothetical protein